MKFRRAQRKGKLRPFFGHMMLIRRCRQVLFLSPTYSACHGWLCPWILYNGLHFKCPPWLHTKGLASHMQLGVIWNCLVEGSRVIKGVCPWRGDWDSVYSASWSQWGDQQLIKVSFALGCAAQPWAPVQQSQPTLDSYLKINLALPSLLLLRASLTSRGLPRIQCIDEDDLALLVFLSLHLPSGGVQTRTTTHLFIWFGPSGSPMVAAVLLAASFSICNLDQRLQP